MPTSSPNAAVHERGICPISFHDARKFVQTHHAYLAAPRGCLFCIAAFVANDIVAVAIINRPVNPSMDDGVTAEISRLCTHDAPPNTASALMRRVTHACKAIGYKRIVTYVDDAFDGATWTASNFHVTAVTTRRGWHGRTLCIDGNQSVKVRRFELRLKGYEAAVTAVTSRAKRMSERRDAWANRLSISGESIPAPR